MPPGVHGVEAGFGRVDCRKLARTATFTTRARVAGCVVAARDNAVLRGKLFREAVVPLTGEVAGPAHLPRSSVGRLQWRIWEFFEDPPSSKSVRCRSPLARSHDTSTPAVCTPSSSSLPRAAGEVLLLLHDEHDPHVGAQLLLRERADVRVRRLPATLPACRRGCPAVGPHRDRLHPALHSRARDPRALLPCEGRPPQVLHKPRQRHRPGAPDRSAAARRRPGLPQPRRRPPAPLEPSSARPTRGFGASQVAIAPWYIDRIGLKGPGFLSLLRIIRAPRPPQERPPSAPQGRNAAGPRGRKAANSCRQPPTAADSRQ